MKRITVLTLFLFCGAALFCQGIIILPNAYVTVQNNAYLKTTGTAGVKITSNTSGTGSLIDVGSGVTVTGTGTTTVERFIPHTDTWHFLSTPVASAPVWPYFTPEPTGSPLSFGASPWKWDLFYWNPRCTSWVANHLPWVNIRLSGGAYNSGDINKAEPDANNAGFGAAVPVFETGKGYMAAYKPDYPGSNPHTFVGTLNSGNKELQVVYYDQNSWNLTGNPYPSAIDWKSDSWGTARSGVLATSGSGYDYWIFNDSLGNYGVFNSAGSSGTLMTSRYIAAMQGFFVKCAGGSGTLAVTSALQTHSTQRFLKENNVETNTLRLTLQTQANHYRDEMILKVDPTQENGGSPKFWSLYAEAPEIYAPYQEENFSIRRIPVVDESSVVPVSIKAGADAGYTLTVSGLESFSITKSVVLEDLKTGEKRDLSNNPVYTFNAGPADPAERFHLHFSGSFGITTAENQDYQLYTSGNVLIVKNLTACQSNATLTVYNLVGQLIYRNPVTEKITKVELTATTGWYLVTLMTQKGLQTRKVFIN